MAEEWDEYYGLGGGVGPAPSFDARGQQGPVQPWMPQNYRDAGKRDPSAYFRNVTGASPGPATIQNRGYWKGAQLSTRWVNRASAPSAVEFSPQYEGVGAEAATCTSRSMVATPLFDLRPDFMTSTGSDPLRAVALWRGGAYGAGAGVTFQFLRPNGGLIPALPPQLEVYVLEEGAPLSSTDQLTVAIREAATAEFFDGGQSATFVFSAPHTSFRFWKPVVIFDWLGAPGSEPEVNVKIMAT